MEKLDLMWKQSEQGVRTMLWLGFAIIVSMALCVSFLDSGKVFFADEMQSKEVAVQEKAASVAVYPARTQGEKLMQKIAVKSLEANILHIRLFFRTMSFLLVKFMMIQGFILICLSILRRFELNRIKAEVAEALAAGKV